MVIIRKNVKNMSKEEKAIFISAVHKLKEKSSGKVGSIYDEFVAIHGALMDLFEDHTRSKVLRIGHRKSSFLTWHRQFLYRLEQELRDIDERVFLPYWDWTDAESTKVVLSPDFMGSPVNGGTRGVPLKDGSFKDWKTIDGEILTRNIGSMDDLANEMKGIFDLIKPAIVTISSVSNYVSFSSGLETKHDFIHVWVGGHMANIGTAVNDPIFFLNHCNVDRLWAMWQDYGNATAFPATGQSHGNNREDFLWPWDGNKAEPESDKLRDLIRTVDKENLIKNGSMLSYRTLRYCYDTQMGALKAGNPVGGNITSYGGAHIYDLDIDRRANYRIYTTGKTDVSMEIFGPALCNNCFGQLRSRDDDSGDGGINASVSITLSPGKYYVIVRGQIPSVSGNYQVTLSVRDDPIPLTLEKPFRATLSQMWEMDWYTFDAPNKADYFIETSGDIDVMIVLYGNSPPNGLIAKDDNSGKEKNALLKQTLEKGTYNIAIRSSANDIGKYSIVVRV